jgi:hypothetical protein
MVKAQSMGTLTSVGKHLASYASPRTSLAGWARCATAIEVLVIYAGILLYIWVWQYSHPRAWRVLLAAVLGSQVLHGDRLRDLGLGREGLRGGAAIILPLASAIFLPLLLYGFARHALSLMWPGRHAFTYFAGYGSWCLAQQYLTQCYFHRRLQRLIRSQHLCSLLVGVMFGGAHIPNPILMIATLVAGYAFAEVYARQPNIWPLALVQTVGGLLIAAVSPPSLIRNMRVGPGYFLFPRQG